MARKIFCDHCGKEISGVEVNEISADDTFFDAELGAHVGWGAELCDNCWEERARLHVKLEREFLHLEAESEHGD